MKVLLDKMWKSQPHLAPKPTSLFVAFRFYTNLRKLHLHGIDLQKKGWSVFGEQIIIHQKPSDLPSCDKKKIIHFFPHK